MKLYHATAGKNEKSILKDGLIPAFPAVYMTDDINAAIWYKNRCKDGIIFEIESDNLDQELLGQYHEMLCDILKTTDFYHYYGTIKPGFLRKI